MACRLHLERDLDWGSLHARVRPRVEQFDRFLQEMQPEVLAFEEEVTNTRFGYIGHLDLRCKIGGREVVVDYKPGPAPWHPLQLSGYAGCFADRPVGRRNLYLEGKYKLVDPSRRNGHGVVARTHTDRHDWEDFLALLRIAQRRQAS